jgi:hypothetical protein
MSMMMMFSACTIRRTRLDISSLLNFAMVGCTFSALQLITHESTAVHCGHVTELAMANLITRLYITPCIAVAAALSSTCNEYIEYIDVYTVFSLLIHESIVASLLVNTKKCFHANDMIPLSVVLFSTILIDAVRVMYFVLIICNQRAGSEHWQARVNNTEEAVPLLQLNEPGV